MREIALANVDKSLRNHVKKIEVDETNLTFINGLAVANATVHTFQMLENSSGGYTPKTNIYNCVGIINENYEEAFSVSSKLDSNKYLAFLEPNKKITRVGVNDFIVETREVEQGYVYKPLTHIRIINQKPQVLVEKNKNFTLTSISNVAILNNCFYFITANKFFGLKFKSLKEDAHHPGEFILVDEIIVPANNEMESPLVDTLTCRIDTRMQVKSNVYSMVEEIPVYFQSNNYQEVHNERIEQLQEKRAKFINHISSLEDAYKQIL